MANKLGLERHDTSDFVFDFLEDLGKLMGCRLGFDPVHVLSRDQWAKSLSGARIYRAFEAMHKHMESRHGITANVHLAESGPFTTIGVAQAFVALLDVYGRNTRRDAAKLLSDLACALHQFLMVLLAPFSEDAGDLASLGELLTREGYRQAVEKALSTVPEVEHDQVLEEAKRYLKMLGGIPDPAVVQEFIEMVALARLPRSGTTLVPRACSWGKLN